MPKIEFNRYYRYEDLSELLFAYETEYKDLVKLISIGKSYEGRDIWLLEVTDSATGPAKDKPAFWVDGNIHASEVSTSTAALRLLNDLVTSKDPDTVRALKTRSFYIVPRINPDGAEWTLESPPRVIRSSTRKYPFEDEDPYGIEKKDLDGDGRILAMRVKDPGGAWKICPQEPRILVLREPGEVGGEYYRLLPEGLIHNFDGMHIAMHKTPQGLDMNRNFPSAWRLEHEQYGAGEYPTSEPEIRAVVQAIVDRPNITGAVCFHTFSGVMLRPPAGKPDDDIAAEDLWAYKTIGQNAERITGYPAISNYHEFRYHPKEIITGAFDDWMYEHRGVFAWTCEIWSPQRQAGITDYKYIEWFRTHPVEDDIKLLKWSDEKLGGKGYAEWKPFEHPQLGPVEIGGWDPMYAFRNPPLDFLEKEIAPLATFCIWQALCSPLLEVRETNVQKTGSSSWRLRVSVQNVGWLPCSVTKVAADRKLCRGVQAELNKGVKSELSGAGKPSPSWLTSGKLRQDGGQLMGQSHTTAGGFDVPSDAMSNVAVFEWVVSEPGDYLFEAKHDRAGKVTAKLKAE